MPDAVTIVFYAAAALVIGSAAIVAFARSIVHSAFALLGAFAGVAVLFLLLSADFVAMIQFVVYIGGILILFLFAVMLTSALATSKATNRSVGVIWAFITAAGIGSLMVWLMRTWSLSDAPISRGGQTAMRIGDALLGPYILPFEIISVLLLLALIGAVILARREVRHQEEERGKRL